jgi:hypothetical protein
MQSAHVAQCAVPVSSFLTRGGSLSEATRPPEAPRHLRPQMLRHGCASSRM